MLMIWYMYLMFLKYLTHKSIMNSLSFDIKWIRYFPPLDPVHCILFFVFLYFLHDLGQSLIELGFKGLASSLSGFKYRFLPPGLVCLDDFWFARVWFLRCFLLFFGVFGILFTSLFIFIFWYFLNFFVLIFAIFNIEYTIV